MKTYALKAANVALWGYCAWSGLGLAIALVFSVVLRRTLWSAGGRVILIATLFLLIPYGLVLIRGA
jgi:hypothetical protein